MTTIVTLDKAGRVVIPKAVREELNIEAGDNLELDSEGGRVTIRPVRSQSPLRKERGIWVFRTGKKLGAEVTQSVLEGLREPRPFRGRGAR